MNLRESTDIAPRRAQRPRDTSVIVSGGSCVVCRLLAPAHLVPLPPGNPNIDT